MKLASDAIKVAIKNMSALVNAKNLQMKLENKKLSLIGVDNGTVLVTSLPCTVETGDKDFCVELSVQALSKATTGRKEITLKLINDNTILNIKAKGYEVELATISDDSSVDFPELEKSADRVDFDQESWTWLQKAVTALTIDPVPGLVPMLYCRSSDKGAFACTFDHIQMMFARTNKSVGKKAFKFYLPYERMSKIFKGLPYDGTKMYVTPGGVLLQAKTFKAFLPLSADSSDIELNQVDARMREIVKLKGNVITLSKEHLALLMENASGLDASNLSISFTPDKAKGGVVADCVSPNGKLKTKLEGSIKSNFTLSQTCINTVVRVSNKDNVELVLGADNAYVVAKTKSIYYVAGTEGE